MEQNLPNIALGMPQLGPVGLSENWLLRHLGNVHWGLICEGLRTPSAAISTAEGDRLYASFARVRWRASKSLKAFSESDVVGGRISINRSGESVYTSTADLTCSSASIHVELLSKFSSRVKKNSNNAFRSGTPVMPASSDIPNIEEVSEFISDHRKLRTKKRFEEAFHWSENCNFKYVYEPSGYFEFNGANLLYFASYPLIANIGLSHYVGNASLFKRKDWITHVSPVSKDIFYFANCDLDDSVVVEVKSFECDDGGIWRAVVDFSRISDGVWMGRVYSVYATNPNTLEEVG
jgi:probable biosynthetic protein (TIGR04098 family)